MSPFTAAEFFRLSLYVAKSGCCLHCLYLSFAVGRFANSNAVSMGLYLTFCWLNRLDVTVAQRDAAPSRRTAVDYYSMCHEVCEIVMSNELLEQPLGGDGVEVEVDECYLTRRKYHKGRSMKTGTVTMLGLYQRASDLGTHLQVCLLRNSVI